MKNDTKYEGQNFGVGDICSLQAQTSRPKVLHVPMTIASMRYPSVVFALSKFT